MKILFEIWRRFLTEEKELKVQKNPDGFTLDVHVNGDHVGQYTHSREADQVRNFAECREKPLQRVVGHAHGTD